MRNACVLVCRIFGLVALLTTVAACGFMPGFDYSEQPLLYHIPVGDVAKQVSCELQDVLSDFRKYQDHYYAKVDTDNPNRLAPPRWYISSDPVAVKLKLATNNSGNVTFGGIRLGNLGLKALSNLITASSTNASTSTLTAKVTPKRSTTATLTFSVSAVSDDGRLAQDSAISSVDSIGRPVQLKKGGAYSQKTKVSGGKPKYTVAVVGGMLPEGVTGPLPTKNKDTVAFEGTLRSDRPFVYIVRVRDHSLVPQSVDQMISGTIEPDLPLDPPPSAGDLVLDANPFKIIPGPIDPFVASWDQKPGPRTYEQTNDAGGGNGRVFEIVGGKLPDGSSGGIDPVTGKVTVENPSEGPFAYIVRLTDKSNSRHYVDQIVSGTIPPSIVPDDQGQVANAANNIPPTHCPDWATHPDHKLFLKAWLTNFFDKINGVTDKAESNYNPPLCDIGDPRKSYSPTLGVTCVPDGTTFTQVDLSTAFNIAADLTGGVSPTLFGDGKVFLIPVSGLTADLNFDYTHEIDITLKLCDNTKPGGCKSANSAGAIDPLSPTSNLQCEAYAALSPIMSGVTPPKDVINEKSQTLTCSKMLGCYILKSTDPKASSREPSKADCVKIAGVSEGVAQVRNRAVQ